MSALTAAELTKGLNLHSIRDRTWQIFGCSAKDGSGLQVLRSCTVEFFLILMLFQTGMEFLARELDDHKSRGKSGGKAR